MRKNKILLIWIFLITCLSITVMAEDVLDIGYGARSIALGRTYTSVKADGYGVFGNPAAIYGINTGEFVSMSGNMQDETQYTLLGYVLPTKKGNFFLSYGGNQITGFTSTTLGSNGRPVAASNFDFRNDLWMLGYQNQINQAIAYGFRIKNYSKGIPGNVRVSGSGQNADIGIEVMPHANLSFGLVGRNIVPGEAGAMRLGNGQKEDIPASLDVGLGYKIANKIGFYTDLALKKNIPSELRVGMELQVVKHLALRFGFEERKISSSGSSYINGAAGIGFNAGILGLDYAYSHDTLMNANSRHFVSISIKTPNVHAVKKQKQEVVKKAEEEKPVEIPKPEIPRVQIPVIPVKEAQQEEEIEYIVQENDWLSKIALKYLGDMMLYKKIAEDNHIKNPDLIFPGQKIIIKKM